VSESAIITIIISGILLGGIYAVIAQGLNLVWGVLRVINFAHGEFLMVGCYITFWLVTFYKTSFFLAPVVSFLLLGALGFCIYIAFIKPMLGSEDLEFNSLLLLFGFSLIMSTGARVVWSPTYRIVPVSYGSLQTARLSLPLNYLLAFAIALLVTVLLYLFLKKTYLGKSVRAVVQNKDSATIIGINPNLVYGTSFAIGCGVAAIGGSLISLIYSIYPDMGFPFAILSFCVVCIGGLGSFWGVFFAGLAVGLIESFVGAFAGAEWEPIVVAVLLLGVLQVRQALAR
jgi:branched-chain amino acid transport system permease protein